MVPQRLTIIGAGQAGLQAAASARQEGFDGEIHLIGSEPVLPYQRPPLSKAYLKGDLGIDRLELKPSSFFDQAEITVSLSQRIVAIDRQKKTVRADNGDDQPYDRLIIATGAPPRRLRCKGADADGVFYLRTLHDSDRLRSILSVDGTIVVVGAGYIGLEVAAVAKSAGRDVVVIELADRPLKRVAGPAVSQYFEDLHRKNGVNLRVNTGLEAIETRDGKAVAAILDSGETIPCAAILVGIGAEPDQGIAQEAGLDCDNGIVVDETARTSDPTIFAAGDVANFPSPFYGRRLRLESVPNAIEQGKAAGINAVRSFGDKEPTPYDALPWFWSDQYDVKLQTAGARPSNDTPGLSELTRRGKLEGSLSVWAFEDDQLQSVDAINDPAAFLVGKKLIAARKQIDKSALSDPSVDLKSLL
ncbi:MAG: FAD-dependent oxidoreductase [Pseudomonadota bacterium]